MNVNNKKIIIIILLLVLVTLVFHSITQRKSEKELTSYIQQQSETTHQKINEISREFKSSRFIPIETIKKNIKISNSNNYYVPSLYNDLILLLTEQLNMIIEIIALNDKFLTFLYKIDATKNKEYVNRLLKFHIEDKQKYDELFRKIKEQLVEWESKNNESIKAYYQNIIGSINNQEVKNIINREIQILENR